MLLRKSDIKQPPAPDADIVPGYLTAGSNEFTLGTVGRELKAVFGELKHNHSAFAPSRGNWSNHDLLGYLLKQTGPAKVWITSWSISEVAMRALVRLIDAGLITEVHALFDERAKIMFPEAYQMAKRNVADLKLTKIHAKCIVIMNDTWNVSVVTSANFNTNRRIEAYVVCEDPVIAKGMHSWIQKELDRGRPFEMPDHELDS